MRPMTSTTRKSSPYIEEYARLHDRASTRAMTNAARRLTLCYKHLERNFIASIRPIISIARRAV